MKIFQVEGRKNEKDPVFHGGFMYLFHCFDPAGACSGTGKLRRGV
jgi:hypothetical protein